MNRIFNYLLIFTLLASCEADDSTPSPNNLQLVDAFPNLQFSRLVDLQNAGDGFLYAVEQSGRIRVFANHSTTDQSSIFLDIQDRVDDRNNEEGLLGLAFHPQYPSEPYLFVNYTTAQSTTRISRFEQDPNDELQALPASEVVLMEFNQPFENHNGGQLVFGPDNFLYIAVGDGGSAGDPRDHGQNRSSLLGSILRIDIDQSQGNLAYAIPSDNPFVNDSRFRDEIYAYGLRNPWRMSFDGTTNLLWAADVGQAEFEEINLISNGGNYGWNRIEGPNCFQSNSCDVNAFEAPYFHYEHDNGNLSITGGYVYRGSIQSLNGLYLYGDYISGRIWGLSISGPVQNQLIVDSNLSISTFGVDHQNIVYVCSLEGKIYRFSQ